MADIVIVLVGDEGCNVFDCFGEWLVSIWIRSWSAVTGICLLSIHCVKHAGAILDSGTVIARLELDDPSRIRQVSEDSAVFRYIRLPVCLLSLF